jgi:uncharacterized membrane protein
MKDLIVVAYDNPSSARATLDGLRSLNEDWLIEINDAVAVYRDYEGQLNIQDSYQMTPGEGASWGVLLGGLLGGLLAAPFTGGLSAAAATGAVAAGAVGGASVGALTGAVGADLTKEDLGLPQDFVDQVGAALKPGDSAIFAVVETYDPERIAHYFQGTGGTIIRTSLSAQQADHIQHVLAGQN